MQWESCRLENGMQLLAGQDEGASGFCLGFYFPRGSAGEPDDRHGVCCLWMEMLLEKLNEGLKEPVWQGRVDWDYTAFTAAKGEAVQLAEVFFRCLSSSEWSQKELDTARNRVKQYKKQAPPENFRELMATEYWRESVYSRPVCAAEEELASLSLKHIQKWSQWIAGAAPLCVLTGQIAPGELRALEDFMETQKKAEGSEREKKIKKRTPREFAQRQNLAGWIMDTACEPAQALVSFDIPSPSDLFAAAGFCRLLNAAKTPEVARILKQELEDLEGFSCTLESHTEASRLLLSFCAPSEKLVSGLRRCFSSISSLKEGMGQAELADLMQVLACGRSSLWKNVQEVNLHMGRYACVDPEGCGEFIRQQGMLPPEKILKAAEEIFRAENMTIAVCCHPGVVKRKKLQKVMMEARILLQSPQAGEEEALEVRRKMLRQFIRDCQAETDAILAGAERPVYSLWKKYQSYIRLRHAQDSHYSFEGVQEFLLGHGYSKDDVKRLKKRKNREKPEGKNKKEENQEDWQRIEGWFFQDTVDLIEALTAGEPWQGAAAAAVKRSNLWMRYQSRTERGLDAVKAVLNGKSADLTRIQAYLERKKAGKNEGNSHTDGNAGRVGEK